MSLLGAWRVHSESRPQDVTGPPDPARQARVACAPPIGAAVRACCCPAQPVARVVLRVDGPGPEQEIFLCAHHLRAGARRLRDLGAAVYDGAGLPLSDPEVTFAAAARGSGTGSEPDEGGS
ncbi:DUF7455 domain-containing protein [Frankia sp. AgKG'84/4]|uniref:DUF7455 domain-containing protein n=1 Tax=Frankia sp. AgKG'84/4 TaxID=573490 RepID=UPI00200DA36E|nr:hypothetical protein [Frankia sp. AgKG'84/4]MCL9795247.1 hypothetical protein [Frankia sp. AgKG'84/4]